MTFYGQCYTLCDLWSCWCSHKKFLSLSLKIENDHMFCLIEFHMKRVLCGMVHCCKCSLLSKTHGRALLPWTNVRLLERLKSSYGKDELRDLTSIIQPIHIGPNVDSNDNVGTELVGKLDKDKLLRLLNRFYREKDVKLAAAEHGLNQKLFHQAFVGFRRFCIESTNLQADLHIKLSDILSKAGHIHEVLPFFISYAKNMFPHLDCMDDLKKISDLRQPASWYPEARAIQRKIIYHAGPTNSGKTFHALQRFMVAKSGVYCGPLRLLANEVYTKLNNEGMPCDLVTGEERKFAPSLSAPSSHVACTVEMTSISTPYEVAVLDEVQMVRDVQRGWAWTRALLGLCAREVHLCGEPTAIPLIKEIALFTGDSVEVRKYKRLTSLRVLDHAVEDFKCIKPGDCIVCFGKQDIYHCSRQLERLGHQAAVIYGGLPAGTKKAQAEKFNDPDDDCSIMVATDAIGMGLNLSINRIIFYSVTKPFLNEKGEKEIDFIDPSTARQIAGRAGRYGMAYEDGEVTTFRSSDLPTLKRLLDTEPPQIQHAGLHPTAEQIELFAFHLPKATLSNLIDIFITLCELDSGNYFLCNVENFKFLADMIEHVPLKLSVRYLFCCAPIDRKKPFVCTLFLKLARQFSRDVPVSCEWLCRQVGWPFNPPFVIHNLIHLEHVFDVLDLYLWLSYRFTDVFIDVDQVRDMQIELDLIIQEGIVNITRLLKNTETGISDEVSDNDGEFLVQKWNKQKEKDEGEEPLPLVKPAKRSPIRERLEKASKVRLAAQTTESRLNDSLLKKELLRKGILTEKQLVELERKLKQR